MSAHTIHKDFRTQPNPEAGYDYLELPGLENVEI